MSADNYKILRALNTNGTVHLAADKDGKKYVLKTLSPDSVSMYRRIAELPPHSHSERVFECIEQDGNTVAVCEYIEGKTLHELLESGRTFPLKDIKKLICDLCSAVEHLHKNGIIHRDINPNNIMLDDKLNVKLIDYSIARLYSGKKDNDTTIFGTEGYSAPEQYGFKETRFTADVYSIGMVLKMLLNSCADGSATEEVQLRRIAAKCTSFDPDGRYKSAAAVRSAVKRSGYVLPVVIGCAALVFAAVFSLGVLMMARDDVESDIISGTAQTTSVTNTATTTAASATSTVTTVSTAETATSSAAISSAATTNSTTTAITTTKATTKSTTTAKTTAAPLEMPTFEFPEYLELSTLKGSDFDNPNKMEVTPTQDENRHFAAVYEYEFFDDPAVHGEWVYCNSWQLNGAKMPATAKGIVDEDSQDWNMVEALRIHDGGSAEIYYRDGGGEAYHTKWTNGYLIRETGDGIFAERLFVSVIDDVEFLFMEFKTLDYTLHGDIYVYYIFTRSESEASG